MVALTSIKAAQCLLPPPGLELFGAPPGLTLGSVENTPAKSVMKKQVNLLNQQNGVLAAENARLKQQYQLAREKNALAAENARLKQLYLLSRPDLSSQKQLQMKMGAAAATAVAGAAAAAAAAA